MLDTPTLIYWWHIKSNDKKKGLIWNASVKNKQRKRTRARVAVHLHTAAVCINRALNSTITVHSFNCATAMLPFNYSANSFETKYIFMKRRYISIHRYLCFFVFWMPVCSLQSASVSLCPFSAVSLFSLPFAVAVRGLFQDKWNTHSEKERKTCVTRQIV